MLPTTYWMVRGGMSCLLDALGYSLMRSACIRGGAWIFAGNWWCFLVDVCWYFLVVSGQLLVVPRGDWMLAGNCWWCLDLCWCPWVVKNLAIDFMT
mmetsp:Transcript_80392/g.134376  ORF Transcript_80392/g.134376 Transcript_80392/m.134376 type:complete len:96 (-) Transcript_80392:152-439(-)